MTGKTKEVYCPHCMSQKPLWKAGFQLMVGGKPEKQRWQCKHCRKFTTKPRPVAPKARETKKGKKGKEA